MNLELFIARRLLQGKQEKAVSVPIVRVALAGIALGVCVMLLSILVITGFKNEITTKLSGFMAHLNVTAYECDDSYAGSEIVLNDSLLSAVQTLPGIRQVYAYVNKPAILKKGDEIHGIVLRGLDSLYDASFYEAHLKEGEWPDFHSPEPSSELLVSAAVASILELKVGDKVTAHFVQDPPRVRRFVVKGIYDTGFKEYDEMVAICDRRHLQRLNGWSSEEVSGLAVELLDMQRIPEAEIELKDRLPMETESDAYRITTLRENAPQVFDWLNLLNMNVWIILILIVVVAGFNMVSGLLILILDKTSFIGIMKALGYRSIRLRRLFLYIAVGLIGKGLLVGNILALFLGALQACFSILRLDPTTYYMDTVPIHFDWMYIILLDIGVWVVSSLMLIIPTLLIARIRPIKAIRFE